MRRAGGHDVARVLALFDGSDQSGILADKILQRLTLAAFGDYSVARLPDLDKLRHAGVAGCRGAIPEVAPLRAGDRRYPFGRHGRAPQVSAARAAAGPDTSYVFSLTSKFSLTSA